MLGKLSVPGRPTNLDYSRVRAYYACNRCGCGLFGHFFSRLSFLFSYSLSLGVARYRLKYCLKGSLSPKTTNQPTNNALESRLVVSPSLTLFQSYQDSGRVIMKGCVQWNP